MIPLSPRRALRSCAIVSSFVFAAIASGGNFVGQVDPSFNNFQTGNTEEIASFDGKISVEYFGPGNSEPVTTSLQVFIIPDGGFFGPTIIGPPVVVSNGSGSDNVIDIDQDGVPGDAFDDFHSGNVDLFLNNAVGASPTLANNIATAEVAAGATGAVGVQVIFSTPSAQDGSTENPTSYNSAFEGFSFGSSSPRVITEDLEIINALSNPDGAFVSIEINQPFNQFGEFGDVNQLNVFSGEINEFDFEISANGTFSDARTLPTVFDIAVDDSTLTLFFDPSENKANLPQPGESIRGIGSDVFDRLGRPLRLDLDGAILQDGSGDDDMLMGYANPTMGVEEFISLESLVEINYVGDGDGVPVSTSIQIFTIPDDGASGPSLVGGPIQIDNGFGGPDSPIGPFSDDFVGTVFIGFEFARENNSAIDSTLDMARMQAGANGAIGIQFIFETSNDPPVMTTLPTTFNMGGSGSFNSDASSPRLLDGTLDLVGAYADPFSNYLRLEFDQPLINNDLDNPNNTDFFLGGIDERDLEVDASALFKSPRGLPDVVSVSFVKPDYTSLEFVFDDSFPVIFNPAPGEFIRVVRNRIRDFTGRTASGDTAGVMIMMVPNPMAPAIAQQPESAVAGEGADVQLAVQVTPGTAQPVTFQWRKNGSMLVDGGRISGSNNQTLIIEGVQSGDESSYDVVVANAFGSVISSVAVVAVQTGDACPGDADGSGIVNFSDLVATLGLFGPCPE